MKDINIGFIGLGMRGYNMLKDVVIPHEKGRIVAVCDYYEDRRAEAVKLIKETQGIDARKYQNWQDLINDDEVNTVIVMSAWENHIEAAIASMKAGKAVAIEVGGAYSIEECWDLVKTYEETKTPFMFLENCCFGKREMMVMNMAKKGVLGKIVHCLGGYHHDLRSEIINGKENRHYRLRNYMSRNCENYPTHELGPIAKILNINKGNRMISLTSTASGSFGLYDYINKNKADDEMLTNARFAQGDVVTTVIKCAGGETITLTLDTSLPRFYSRGFTVRGTNGLYEEQSDSIFLDREEDIAHDFDWLENKFGNAKGYEEEYMHPLWKKYEKEGVKTGHGGIDWLEFEYFFDSLINDKPMVIDVYDAAAWMCITALSEQSIALGGAPVTIPDFTKGKWQLNACGDMDDIFGRKNDELF